MGNLCGSSEPTLPPADPAERKVNAQITAQNLRDHQIEQGKIKLLLLGTGESGKSTILKQVKKLYGKGIVGDELYEWIPRVYENVNKQIDALIEGAKMLEMPIDEELSEAFKQSFYLSREVDEDVAKIIKSIWSDPNAQKAWERRAEFQIIEAIEYYVENIDRIAAKDYVPTFLDVVQARIKTSGIVTESFEMEGIPFELYDVGGQRNERKKWINCFDNVTSVIFVTAINEYDQKLYEDSTTDRMMETLTVFEQIVNNPTFKDISFVVFLNKFDLFESKIFHYPYRVSSGPMEKRRNEDFKGPYAENAGNDEDERQRCIDAAAKHTQDKFENLANDRTGFGAIIYHRTTAIDSKNIQLVFKACREQILRVNLTKSGFVS